MHQIVLLTALTATTGLFGGGRSCGGQGGCFARPAQAHARGPVYYYGGAGGCAQGNCGSYAAAPQPYYQAAPGYAAPQQPGYVAPQQPGYVAPQQPGYVAPQAAQVAAPYSVSSFYYAPSSCPGGNCARR